MVSPLFPQLILIFIHLHQSSPLTPPSPHFPSCRCRKNQQYDSKWYIPLTELTFQGPEETEPLTIPQVPDEELDAMKVKISHLRSEIQREKVVWMWIVRFSHNSSRVLFQSFPNKSVCTIELFSPAISESQQGFKSHRPSQEEAVRTGVPSPVNVSEYAPPSLQQERQGDDALSFLIIILTCPFDVSFCISPSYSLMTWQPFFVCVSELQFPDFIWLWTCRVEGDNQRTAEEM